MVIGFLELGVFGVRYRILDYSGKGRVVVGAVVFFSIGVWLRVMSLVRKGDFDFFDDICFFER